MRIQPVVALTLATALFAATIGSAVAMERKVQINNQTSYTIVEFYASNTGTNDWQEDILGSDVLPSGSSVNINIDDGSGYCKYDFLAVFDDGDQLVSADNNVCELDTFNFTD
jgi:FlaG/FlaF family flagellin (archaellin)